MKRLAVLPSDPIQAYLKAGYDSEWLRGYFNPSGFFDELYFLSPLEPDNPNLLGGRAFQTQPDELPRRLRELKIDVVRAYGGFEMCDMACLHKALGVPVIVSIHDTNPALLYDSVARADFVWCARQLTDFVTTKFRDRTRIWDLPNGIPFDVMRPYQRSETLDLDEKYQLRTKYKILQVGRRTRQKNLETLIRALRILGPEYGLLTSGAGNADEYRRLAVAEGVADRCVWVESIANRDMPRHFAWADCLAHPTRWEGMSLLIVEALASAAIVVVSDIPEMKGIIEDGHNALLVKDYESPDGLARVLRTACTDQQVRATLQQHARPSVEQFEMGRVRQIEADLYARVYQMKHSIHVLPFMWRKAGWALEDVARNNLPQPFKTLIKQALRRQPPNSLQPATKP